MHKNLHPTARVDSNCHQQDGLTQKLETQMQPMEDDRFPGSFFRIPGVPAPGKTTWSLAK